MILLIGIGELLPKLKKEYFVTNSPFPFWYDIREEYKVLRNYLCHDMWNSLNNISKSKELWIKKETAGEITYYLYGQNFEKTLNQCLEKDRLMEVRRWSRRTLV